MTPAQKTPRTTRGLVRKVSKLNIHYPEFPFSTKPPTRAASEPSMRSTSKSSPSRKRVSWVDEELLKANKAEDEVYNTLGLVTSYSLEDGTPTLALQRSMKLLDSLYDLRRVDADGEEEQDDALLQTTLKDTHDCEAILRSLEFNLVDGTGAVAECGGARHATCVITSRTLHVVKRKADLLQAVEQRTAAIERIMAGCDKLCAEIVAGTTPAPAELGDIKRFRRAHTHNGNPADENKTDFLSFANSFRLPASHDALFKLRDVAAAAGEWWAEACVREATKGIGHKELRRLFDVALGTGLDPDHYKLVRAEVILTDRLAERVIKEAKERLERDTMMADRAPGAPPVGPAAIAADKIEVDMKQAVAEGVKKSDLRLKEAAAIAQKLRENDGQRKRLANREKRLAEKANASS